MKRFWSACVACCAASVPVQAESPAVFWASSPVKPGEAVMVQGWGWGKEPKLEVQRLKDGDAGKPGEIGKPRVGDAVTVVPLHCNDEGLSFVLPHEWKPGLFRFSVVDEGGRSEPEALNAPAVWWAQGDWGREASPGGWLRLFGNSLSAEGKAVVALKGSGETVVLKPVKQDCWALTAELPQTLAAGEYQLFVHNGQGGSAGWSAGGTVRVAPHAPLWKEKRYDITAFGAIANDAIDDTLAVRQALEAAGADGGGIVFVPRGRFQLNGTLAVPRLVLLKGAGKDLSLLYWRDSEEPLPVLIQGSNSFGVEELTLLAANHRDGIVSDASDVPGAGNVFLRRLVMRLNRFEAHDTEMIAARLLPMGDGPYAVRLAGDNVQVTECEIFSSGGPLNVSGTHALVSRNRLFAGDSIYVLGGRRIVFEDNTLDGGPMARGGGVYCRQLYYARNRMGMTPRHDGEVFTTDGGGHTLVKIAALDGVRLTMDEAFAKKQPHWNGFVDWWRADKYPDTGLYVMKGKGAGQYRWIASHDGLTCVLDRPWTVEPDDTSVIFFCVHNFDRNLLVGNDFHDATIVQSYAGGTEWIMAENRFTRIGGVQIFTHHDEPAWRMQCLDNEILAGSNYRGPESAAFDQDAHLGMVSSGGRATVFRGNALRGNARLNVLRGRNALVEANTVCESDVGIAAGGEATVLRNNRFERVGEPIRDSGRAVIHPAERLSAELCALDGALPEGAAAVVARLGALAKKPPQAPGLEEDVRECAAELAKAGAASSRNGTYPLALFKALFAAGLKTQCSDTKPLAQGGGGTLKQWLDVTPHVYVPPVKVSLTFDGHPKYRIAALSGVLTSGKPWGSNLPVELEPGVSTAFRAPLTWAAAGEGWTLSGVGSIAVGGYGGRLPLTQWAVCGPFPNAEKGRLDKAVRGPERRLDLAAQYDTASGKKGWSFVTAPKLDFLVLYGQQRSASAFALAVLRAKKPTPFALQCRVGPGALMLNGQSVLLPRSRQVSGTLKAGDNIVLMKVANEGESWGLGMELSVAENVDPGDVQVLSADQLKTVAELNPKPKPALPEGAALPFSGGVNWKLTDEDDFDRTRLGADWGFRGIPNWMEGVCRLSGGAVTANGFFSYLTYFRRLTLPLRVEYDVKVGRWGTGGALVAPTLTPANEMYDRRLWGRPAGSGYMLCLGWHNQKTDHLWRDAEEVVLRDPGKKLLPDTWHHVVAQFAPPKATLIVDGQVALEYEDKAWLPNLDTFTFFSGFVEAQIDNVRIYEKGN